MTLRILLADDHPLVSTAARDQLQTQAGWEVCGMATSATDLLCCAQALRPDVVITDYHMPGPGDSDGIRLISTLRRHYPAMAVIVLTMITNPMILRSILKSRVHGLLLKDAPPSELVTAVVRIQRGFDYVGKSALEILTRSDPDSLIEPGQPVPQRMSVRETEVIRLYLSGRSVSEIAGIMCRSVKTISRQKNCAMQKLGANNDRELFECAARQGILLPS